MPQPKSVKTTYTEVSDTNTSVQLVAYDNARVGVSIWNDSTAILYLLVGSGTASPTEAGVKVAVDGYWEAPYNYCGQIQGIWASDASGQARITEYF